MRGDDLAEFARGSAAYLDAQRRLLESLTRAGAVTAVRAVALHAELDQVAAALRQCHRVLHTRIVE